MSPFHSLPPPSPDDYAMSLEGQALLSRDVRQKWQTEETVEFYTMSQPDQRVCIIFQNVIFEEYISLTNMNKWLTFFSIFLIEIS